MPFTHRGGKRKRPGHPAWATKHPASVARTQDEGRPRWAISYSGRSTQPSRRYEGQLRSRWPPSPAGPSCRHPPDAPARDRGHPVARNWLCLAEVRSSPARPRYRDPRGKPAPNRHGATGRGGPYRRADYRLSVDQRSGRMPLRQRHRPWRCDAPSGRHCRIVGSEGLGDQGCVLSKRASRHWDWPRR